MLRLLIIYCLIFTWGALGPAAAVPRLDILTTQDATLYKQIFGAQDRSDFKTADKLIRRVKNKLLMGHVQFQRYLHPTGYKSKFGELRTWLSKYNDHPEAYRAFSLAMKRKPKKSREPKRPVYGQVHILALVGEAPPKPTRFVGKQEKIARDVRRKVRKGDNAGAVRILESAETKRILSTVKQDTLAARVAMGYFVDGEDEAAYRLAAKAGKRSGEAVGQAHWVAGLSAYRSGWIDRAVRHFEANAVAEGATSWTSAAGAFWAGRIHLALGDTASANRWLGAAAHHNRTFYGQLALHALHALDAASPFTWDRPAAGEAEVGRLKRLKAGKRALALLQIGERWRADQELQPLVKKAQGTLLRTILSVAVTYDAPRAAVQAAHRLNQTGGEFIAAGLYPIAPWKAKKNHRVDHALVLAFMRQESQFNPRAASPAGARGLMQVLPSTANYVVGEKRYSGARRDGLFDPEQSVEIGARYIRYLLDKDAVGGGLFRLAIAYNAGIGNLIRWQREVRHNDDPLLFIEAIPSRETRVFVERVLANFWLYQDQLGQNRSSRDDVAQGRWPIYIPQD